MPLLFARRGRFACLTVAFLLSAARSLAADAPVEISSASSIAPLAVQPLPCLLACSSVPPPAADRRAPATGRPAALVPLYSVFAALQFADAHSTMRALARGAREGNPFMTGLAGSPTAIALVKGASFAGIVYASERLWRHHRALAVVTMVGLNAGYSAAIAHNYLAVR